jgi:signal transduction histidine kinase
LGAELRREVYLIFKECVNNLVKHSGCAKAELAFSFSGSFLIVSINDNGKGFAPAEPGKNGLGGHGLTNMQRRARALGGSLKIDSEIGRGTKVTLKVPIWKKSRWLVWPFTYPNGR